MSTIEATAGQAADRAIRVPANLMAVLRQSYDTRQKALDWLLAAGVVGVLWWTFSRQVSDALWPAKGPDPEQGKPDPPVPNTDVYGAFTGVRQVDIYQYNLPPSRASRYGQGPRLTRPPYNPSMPPSYTTP